MKLIFIGTGTFAVPILKALAQKNDWSVDLVISEPAKPTGRKKELVPSPISYASKELNLSLSTPENLEKEFSYKADIIITADYGQLIPKSIFNSPKFKTINVHPSLLPELRGPSPIQYAFLEGRDETGVSLMVVDDKFDHGPILSQEKLIIGPNYTYNTLEPKLAELGAEMLIRDLPKYISGVLMPQEQSHQKTTYTKKIKKEDGRADWSRPAQEIYNQWRAYVRWPGIFTSADNLRLNLIEISLASLNKEKGAGTIFSENRELFIQCGEGVVQVTKIKPEGKRVMVVTEFINGYSRLLNKKLT